jgi:uncharacterized protein YbjT (DUF2867 family)
MDRENKTILVLGATGKQGNAVARYLLNEGWNVRAFVRDPDKEAARRLQKLGAELFQGDLDDPASVREACLGAYGVFSMQNPWQNGVEKEIEQGMRVADAAKEAGVQHFVYSSVGSADRNSGIPHFESKWKIEQHIHDIGLTATIFRPVYFMENFLMPETRSAILNGTLAMGLEPDKKLQLIAVNDIGGFVARAFDSPEEYLGKSIDLAGDELTGPEMAKLFSEMIDRPVIYTDLSIDQIRAFGPEWAIMVEWFNKVGYNADIHILRKINPGLKTFRTWISETGWREMVLHAEHAHS